MGNIVRKLLRRKEDYASALVQIAEDIEQKNSALSGFHSSWRTVLFRLTYLAIIIELSYAVYWYFFTAPNPPPLDTALHILILASIPPLWYLMVLLIGAYYRYRITATEEKLQEMKIESQKKLELFKENGTYKEVSSLMAQLEARTPRRGGGGPPRGPDGKPLPGRAQAPSTEPRSKRPGITQPIQGDAATVKVAPSTVAVKRTNRGDKGDPMPSEAPVRQIASDPLLASAADKSESIAATGDEDATNKNGNGKNAHATSHSTSSLPNSTSGSLNGRNQPVATPSQGPQRLHLNPVPQSPYRQQYVPSGRQAAEGIAQAPESKGWMDWFVDKLVGSEATTPKWCAFCGAHNGLVPVDELPNTRFVCHNCKNYNSPEVLSQLKGVQDSSSSTQSSGASAARSSSSSSSASSSSSSSPEEAPKHEESVLHYEKSKAKRTRRSSVGPKPDDAEPASSSPREEVVEGGAS